MQKRKLCCLHVIIQNAIVRRALIVVAYAIARARNHILRMTIVVTICGAGNGAHVMMAHLGSVPSVETRVLEIRRADNLRAALTEADNIVMCHNQARRQRN